MTESGETIFMPSPTEETVTSLDTRSVTFPNGAAIADRAVALEDDRIFRSLERNVRTRSGRAVRMVQGDARKTGAACLPVRPPLQRHDHAALSATLTKSTAKRNHLAG